MDSLTHTVLGACIGEAVAGKRLGKKAMLWGAIANNIPDIDVISNYWLGVPDSLLAHRGFTHSFLFFILFTPLLAYLFQKSSKKSLHFTFFDWNILIGSGILVHLIIDAFTTYGIGWFEPFSHYRVSFNSIFIVDPSYTLVPLIGALILLVLKSSSAKRPAWAWIGIIVSSCYLIYTAGNKIYVDGIVKKSFEKNNLLVYNYFSTPTPFNNFLWYIVVMDSAGANIGYYSIFDKTKDISYHYFPRNDTALVPLKDRTAVQKLIRFSQGFYVVENKNALLVFNDLRFGQVGGWYIPDAPFVFKYNLFKDEENASVLQQGRREASTKEALKKLFERMKGK